MKVSVIINTYNRGYQLKRLIDTLKRQTYNEFEVIVVNGPSTDNTKFVIEQYKNVLKVLQCPVVNLCVSRNMGIRAASGDIIVFIDDDAVPAHEFWLEELVSYYKKDNIGGVGGKVYKLYGEVEFSNGYIDIWGYPYHDQINDSNYNEPNGEFFNIIPGGNCSFLRKAIIEVNGFDEFYEYYHDESDLAVRLIKAGYKIFHHPNAAIYHEAAGSHIRKSKFHLNWYVIVKNQVYFGIKNSMGYGYSDDEIKEKVIELAKNRLKDYKWMLDEGHISKDDYNKFIDMWDRGLKEGLRAGFEEKRILKNVENTEYNYFKKFDKNILTGMNICMLSEFDIINPIGGTPTHTARLARDFVQLGHNVHVICKGDSEAFDSIDGINIHKIIPESIDIPELNDRCNSKRVIEFSYSAYKKIEQLDSVFGIDIIETPLWDVHGIVNTYLSDIPICTRLQTPQKMVAKTFGYVEDDDLLLIEDFEKELLERSDGVICISDCIKSTIEKIYQVTFPKMITKNYLGVELNTKLIQKKKEDKKNINIFFVGRLERRKGIHNLLDAIPEVLNLYPNVCFRIAGDNDIIDKKLGKTFKESFLEKNKNFKHLNKIKFLGKITNEEKEAELNNCDIFVAPSLYESFGIIFIEAMKYKKPVIGTRAGGISEVIEDKVSGLLCNIDDSVDLKEKLLALIENENMRKNIGENGYERVNKMFSNIKQAQEAVEFYRKVIKSKE